MKNIILSLALITFFSINSIAQGGDKESHREEAHKRIEASKVAYLTTYLDLSSEEAAKFWPVYNEYQAEIKALHGDKRKRKKVEDMTDAEAAQKVDHYVEVSTKKAAIYSKYMTRFKSILSNKKILMLKKAESDFKKQMVKRYADRKGKGGPRAGHKK